MAKLFFRYSAMNSGKSTMAIQVAHNYDELGLKVLVFKPEIDTKGADTIVSRVGIKRKVDYLLKPDDSPIRVFKKMQEKYEKIDAIIVDEAQFLTEEQVNELYYLTKIMNVAIMCFGLRCDFRMNLFPGSSRLLALADKIEEIKNMCRCGEKATQNLRKINGIPTFDGDQVAIDGEKNITYEAVCGKCFINYYLESKNNLIKERRKK